MNEIIKFTDYTEINENVIIPVVDAVIDNNGNLRDRDSMKEISKIPLKGTVELKSAERRDVSGNPIKTINRDTNKETENNSTEKVVDVIKGQDGEYYPGGLDKNGKLLGNFDDDGNLITVDMIKKTDKDYRKTNGQLVKDDRVSDYKHNPDFIGQPILIDKRYKSNLPPEIQKKYPYWNKYVDYIKLVPKSPTGWVNVKVDMEVIKRVRRYSIGLLPEKSSEKDSSIFFEKIKSLDRISNGEFNKARNTKQLQKQMSAIILLHYINEIKTFFSPSTSGLLFESFLGGLIPDARVTEDNGKADISVTTDQGVVEYQVKLYSQDTSNISITYKDSKEPLEYYLICIKRSDCIDIYVLNSLDPGSDGYYKKFMSGKERESDNFSMSKISKAGLSISQLTKFRLSLTNIDKRIEELGTNLKSNLDDLYNELSDFQYNVETIITGVNEETNKLISPQDFTNYSNKATSNVEAMSRKLSSLVDSVKAPK